MLFEQSLLEMSTTRRASRKLAAALSFTLQSVLVGLLVLVPLLFTEALPARQLVTYLVAPAPPPPPPPPAAAVPAQAVVRRVQSDIADTGQLRTPTRVPTEVQMLREETPPPMIAGGGIVGGVPGGIPGGQLGGVIGGIISSTPKAVPQLPAIKPVIPKRVRVSQGVTQGMVIRKIQPNYPVLAKTARIQGTVLLHAIISKDGSIQNLQVMSGHPMLVSAAVNAVKEWHYKPYLLSGQPVEVETEISVTFRLG